MVTRSAAPPPHPQMVWEAPPPVPVVRALVGLIGNPSPSFPNVVWGLVGGNPPPFFPPCIVGSGAVDSVLGSLGLLVVVKLL